MPDIYIATNGMASSLDQVLIVESEQEEEEEEDTEEPERWDGQE